MHQLPIPTLGYLPLWLETLRVGLSADSVAALWCHAPDGVSPVGDSSGGANVTCGYAPQAPISACERLASCGWTMPIPSPNHGGVLFGHARKRSGAAGRSSLPSHLHRPPALDACLADGDVLDAYLLPASQAADECLPPTLPHGGDGASPTGQMPPLGALRLLVSRSRTRSAFSTREVAAFETVAAEFANAPVRPHFPPLPPLPPLASAMLPAIEGQAMQEGVGDVCVDVSGTLVWHRRQPEWADPGALTLMRRVWQLVPGRAWPDACMVVQACQRLADELTLNPCGMSGAAISGAQIGTTLPVPGGILHLHATHLCGMGGRATERVRISLHLAVPPVIRLLARLWDTALTPVQREIAMRLLAGQSRTQTREACAIGVQTLKTHLSLMRARLDPVRDASLLHGLRSGKTTPRLE
ncbi:helix-turn-helix transcriptional regulator [Pandoraea sp. NPDC090278]|uniref:helix-turn-helix transcriptional regulator n=1 Tax=Pandoraea sp. NPDC090278 TaxID=3364391 RepID=UPI00383A481E